MRFILANKRKFRWGKLWKTVQLDNYNKYCRSQNNASWSCDDSNIRDYVTFYTGDCGGGTTTTTTTSSRPSCNSVSLSVSPPVRSGQSLQFNVSGDASTYLSDNFPGSAITLSQIHLGLGDFQGQLAVGLEAILGPGSGNTVRKF